jgi:hypothetical protein
MSTGNHFLKNTWYVAAWSHEIAADGMLARTITRLPLIFWRDSVGKVALARLRDIMEKVMAEERSAPADTISSGGSNVELS